MEKTAVISDCTRYRYLLRRAWDHDMPRLLFVMLNPSTADHEIDDPTIRSCIRLAKALGYGSFEVVNLYGFRSTDPDALGHDPRIDIVGAQNDQIIDAALTRCDVVVCAWGAHKSANTRRTKDIVALINSRKPMAYCLGKTKSGAPKHPLYIKTGTPIVAYE